MGLVRIFFSSTETDGRSTPRTSIREGSPWEKIKYNIDLMETIEFEGEDFRIIIGSEKARNFKAWQNETYPTEEVRDKVLEIMYFTLISIRIDELALKVNNEGYSEKGWLRDTGEEVVAMIDSLLYTNKYYHHKEPRMIMIAKGYINESLREEVSLMENLPAKYNSQYEGRFKTSKGRFVSDIKKAADAIKDLIYNIQS